MSNINIKSKGGQEIVLSREYNSNSLHNLNKDDVGFNDTPNQFSDFCLNSICGNWENDKIKIISLPNKGRLFYLTNPYAQNEIYADCYIGQEIIIRSMVDEKVLMFAAEGTTDNAFTGNYLTEFTIERYCGDTPSNVLTKVKINMVDMKLSPKIDISLELLSSSEVCPTTTKRYRITGNGKYEIQFNPMNNVESDLIEITNNNALIYIEKISGNGHFEVTPFVAFGNTEPENVSKFWSGEYFTTPPYYIVVNGEMIVNFSINSPMSSTIIVGGYKNVELYCDKIPGTTDFLTSAFARIRIDDKYFDISNSSVKWGDFSFKT